jgi:hypothetical protein
MAMMTLVLLTTLMLAFSVLSQSEPVIASNQLRVSQSRALAESGMEHAIWALSAGNVLPGEVVPDGALANPLPSSPAPAPFNLGVFTSIGSTGGYRVQVTAPNPLDPRDLRRDILSIGWTPTEDVVADGQTKAHRRIAVTVQALPDLALLAPCALCVRGDLQVTGNSLVDARADPSHCGGPQKYGAYTGGSLEQTGSSSIKGQAGTDPNGNVEGVDYVQNQNEETFDGLTFNDQDLNTLKKLAKENGTYFGPGFSGLTSSSGTAETGTWTGSVAFSSFNKVKSGVVFIDTATGQNITPSTPEAEFASATISGNPFMDPAFTGMIVVNGSMHISGNMRINGLVYAADDLTYFGTGTGEISGLVISQNVRNTSATAIADVDATTTGNSRIKFNCAHARGAGQAPRTFALVPGTYREMAD